MAAVPNNVNTGVVFLSLENPSYLSLSGPKFFQARLALRHIDDQLQRLASLPTLPFSSGILIDVFRDIIESSSGFLDELDVDIAASRRRLAEASAPDSAIASTATPTARELLEDELELRLRDVDFVIKLLAELSAFLRYITSSRTDSVPASMLNYLTRGLATFQPPQYIFLRKQWRANFKYGEFISQLTQQKNVPYRLADRFPVRVFRVAMVSVPALLEDDYLHCCLLAHEVGHHYDLLAPLSAGHDFILNGDLKEQISAITSLSNRWQSELSADIFATLMLGPAYIFALLDFEVPRNPLDHLPGIYQFSATKSGEDSQAYPSLRMRLHCCLHTLDYFDQPFSEKLTSLLSEGQSELRNVRDIFADEIALQSLEFLRNTLVQLKQQCEANAVFAAISEELADLAIPEVTKGEISRIAHASWRAILNRLAPSARNARDRLGREEGYALVPIEKLSWPLIRDCFRRLNAGIPISDNLSSPQDEAETGPLDRGLILNVGWMRYIWLQNWHAVNEYRGGRESPSPPDMPLQHIAPTTEPPAPEQPNHSLPREFRASQLSTAHAESLHSLRALIKRSVDASDFHEKFLAHGEILGGTD